jgi:hypothetical protein
MPPSLIFWYRCQFHRERVNDGWAIGYLARVILSFDIAPQRVLQLPPLAIAEMTRAAARKQGRKKRYIRFLGQVDVLLPSPS